MPSQTGATNYHSQLGIPDKGQAIKKFVVFYKVWLGYMKVVGHDRTRARCLSLVPCCGQDGYRAQVHQNPIEK